MVSTIRSLLISQDDSLSLVHVQRYRRWHGLMVKVCAGGFDWAWEWIRERCAGEQTKRAETVHISAESLIEMRTNPQRTRDRLRGSARTRREALAPVQSRCVARDSFHQAIYCEPLLCASQVCAFKNEKERSMESSGSMKGANECVLAGLVHALPCLPVAFAVNWLAQKFARDRLHLNSHRSSPLAPAVHEHRHRRQGARARSLVSGGCGQFIQLSAADPRIRIQSQVARPEPCFATAQDSRLQKPGRVRSRHSRITGQHTTNRRLI